MNTIINIYNVLVITVTVVIGATTAGCYVEERYSGPDEGTSVRQDAHGSLSLAVKRKDSRTGTVDVALKYNRDDAFEGPRVMELFIRHTDSVRFISSVPGKATLDAGKELVVQKRDGELLRTVIYSASNLDTLDSGTLVAYRFQKIGDGEAVLEMLTERPIFAPAEANQGLIVSDPLTISFD